MMGRSRERGSVGRDHENGRRSELIEHVRLDPVIPIIPPDCPDASTVRGFGIGLQKALGPLAVGPRGVAEDALELARVGRLDRPERRLHRLADVLDRGPHVAPVGAVRDHEPVLLGKGGVGLVATPLSACFGYASASGQGRSLGRATLVIETGSIHGGRSGARRPRRGEAVVITARMAIPCGWRGLVSNVGTCMARPAISDFGPSSRRCTSTSMTSTPRCCTCSASTTSGSRGGTPAATFASRTCSGRWSHPCWRDATSARESARPDPSAGRSAREPPLPNSLVSTGRKTGEGLPAASASTTEAC